MIYIINGKKKKINQEDLYFHVRIILFRVYGFLRLELQSSFSNVLRLKVNN